MTVIPRRALRARARGPRAAQAGGCAGCDGASRRARSRRAAVVLVVSAPRVLGVAVLGILAVRLHPLAILLAPSCGAALGAAVDLVLQVGLELSFAGHARALSTPWTKHLDSPTPHLGKTFPSTVAGVFAPASEPLPHNPNQSVAISKERK